MICLINALMCATAIGVAVVCIAVLLTGCGGDDEDSLNCWIWNEYYKDALRYKNYEWLPGERFGENDWEHPLNSNFTVEEYSSFHPPRIYWRGKPASWHDCFQSDE